MNLKIASIDIGLKRIGLAICLNNSVVTPLPAIIRQNRNQAAKELLQVLKEWEIAKLVVGLPSNQEMQKRIKHFIGLLAFDKEIAYQNEDLSSLEAKELLKGQIKQKRDGRIDSLAAKIILQRYLNL